MPYFPRATAAEEWNRCVPHTAAPVETRLRTVLPPGISEPSASTTAFGSVSYLSQRLELWPTPSSSFSTSTPRTISRRPTSCGVNTYHLGNWPQERGKNYARCGLDE